MGMLPPRPPVPPQPQPKYRCGYCRGHWPEDNYRHCPGCGAPIQGRERVYDRVGLYMVPAQTKWWEPTKDDGPFNYAFNALTRLLRGGVE